MKEVLSWIMENYKLVILIASCFLDAILFVFCLFKKKVNPSISGIACQLPDLVGIAEEKFGAGHGVEKKKFVLDAALLLYKKATGVLLEEDGSIAKLFSSMIETILSTPQKKGK